MISIFLVSGNVTFSLYLFRNHHSVIDDDELFRDFDTSCFDPAPSSIVSANIPSPAVAHQSVMEVKMFPCNPYPPSNRLVYFSELL